MTEVELRQIIESVDRMSLRVGQRFIADPKKIAPLMNKSVDEVQWYLERYFPQNVARAALDASREK